VSKAARSALEALAYLLLGTAALALGVFGLLRGQVAAPVKLSFLRDISRTQHSFWYWGVEVFWFFVGGALLLAALAVVRELLRRRRRIAATAAAKTAAPAAAAPPKPAQQPLFDLKSTSPGGHYQIRVYPWEARMSLWIECPVLVDTTNGRQLFATRDSHWSLDSAQWQNESVVTMRLRKYPGDHSPGQFEATLDCLSLAANLDGVSVGSVDWLEAALEQAYRTGQKAFAASRKA
jgi:hypothetical protein